MKYIVLKKLWYNKEYKGCYYMTKIVSIYDELTDLVLKTAFYNYNEANDFLQDVANKDYPFKKKGFSFEYKILEVE